RSPQKLTRPKERARAPSQSVSASRSFTHSRPPLSDRAASFASRGSAPTTGQEGAKRSRATTSPDERPPPPTGAITTSGVAQLNRSAPSDVFPATTYGSS